MPPDIATFFDMDIHRCALGHDDAFDLGVSLKGVVDILLERDALTTAVASVCCHHNFRAAVRKAVLDALAAKPAEDDRVNRSNSGAGQHRDDGLRNQRHVDQNAVAFFNAIALEDISKDADFAMELMIGQRAALAGLTFPNDGRLVAARSVEMAIEAVLRGV
jgi:hypothetical protein